VIREAVIYDPGSSDLKVSAEANVQNGHNAACLPFASGIDFGGCKGPQSPKSTHLTFEVDVV